MNHSDLSGKFRPTSRWGGLAAAALLAIALAGCGGGDDGAPGAAGAPGAPGAAGPAGPAGPAAVGAVQIAALTPEQWAAATFKAEITGVKVSSPPVVSFKVTDAMGKPVVGLGNTAQTSTAKYASYPNVAFSLAKLVPRTDNSPSKWVSYIVTNAETTAGVVTLNRPTTDNNGVLVDNKDGTYSYTFRRDVTTMKDQVAALPAVSLPLNKADLGDLTWEPNLPHRLTIQISGAARGTGSNTADGATVTPSVNMSNPVNVVYNFVPATGQAIAAANLTRQVVSIESCNTCHEKLALHGGGRIDTQYCVVCHTDQRKYGFANVASVGGKFPALTETATVDATTGITTYRYAPETRVADGEVAGNFTTMVHKIHMGKDLVKENYNFANVAFNNKGFSKLEGGQRMCSTCHDNTKAVNADNWMTVPSRVACGSCHDGINWATGGGSTLADKQAATAVGAILATSGHVGKAKADDATCALCHDAASIKVDHRTTNITKNNPVITDGLASFSYDIKSATVNAATNDLTIEFGIKQRIAPSTTDTLVTFVAPAPGVSNSLTGFTGGPGFLLAYAMPQDGFATPADYNNVGNAKGDAPTFSIANLLNTNNAANGSLAPSTTTPGYYVATIKGTGNWKFPVGAKMRAVALQSYYTQIAAPATPTAGIARHAISVVKPVTGDAVRRTVVDSAKCANCHELLELHGGSRVKETQVCVMCHNTAKATSARGISDATLAAYTFTAADMKILGDWKFNRSLPNAALNFPVTSNNFKDMIHGIHAGRERATPFIDARDRTPAAITLLDFRRMDFPGKLNNCATCHVTPSNSNVTSFNTVPENALVSTHESIDAAYAAAIGTGTATPALAKTSLNAANATDAVTTPFAAACAACHDNTVTKAHISLNGGLVKATRAQATGAVESCVVCHGPGREFDTAVVHK